jgi:tRNA threonylcarbamoyladenosine biosynthesis protein TsaB
MLSPRSILALDATTSLCSVAWTDGSRFVERVERAGQRHSELIVGLVDATLGEAGCPLDELTEIAFGAGPGSFTGLRIAAGVAQGLGYGKGIPVRAISSLLALAQATRAATVLTVIDARMNEVYWAAYVRDSVRDGDANDRRVDDDRGWRVVIEPVVSPASGVVVPPGDDWVAAGDGFAAYPELGARLREHFRIDTVATITARAIAELALLGEGNLTDAALAIPHYVRDKVALTTAERASPM